MTSESKILTVSYGTFSCTLEGFDDPFDTMRAIAEYFRDLAEKDRYFGAEPPQPDAAMLHRVAEREVARIVDTQFRDRAAPAQAAPLSEPAPTAVKLDAARGALTDSAALFAGDADGPTVEILDAAPAEVTATVAGDQPTLQDAAPEGFRAKLARIRKSLNPPPFEPLPEDLIQPFMAETVAAEAAPEPETAVGIAVEIAAEPDFDVLRRFGALVQSPDGEDLAEITADEPDFAETVVDALAEADAIEPDLAEVSRATEAGADLHAEAEALEAAVPDQALADEAAQMVEDVPLSDADADLAAEVSVDEALAEDIQPLAAAEDANDTGIPVEMPEVSQDAAHLPMEAALPEVALADFLPEDAPEDFAPSEAGLAQAMAEDPLPEDSEGLPVADAPAEAVQFAPQTMGKGSGRYERISSRVVRLNPDDGSDHEAVAPASYPATNPATDPAATRQLQYDESDAEIARLLQQAEAVMAEDANRLRHESIAFTKAAVDATEAERGETGAAQPLASDAYLDDLAKVVEPEPQPEMAPLPPPQQRRRKTVSVRIPGVPRPAGFSPPPLVLVTEQRIDRAPPPMMPPPMPQHSAQLPATALQPSRDSQPMVALRSGRLTGAIGIGSAAASQALPQHSIVLETPYQAAQADAEDEEDFDEALTEAVVSGLIRFADRIGARSTAEMLEAAAAFATCVENRTQFTRPQLMRRLLATDLDRSITREDGLRSFGTLLRTGRIQKVGRGFYLLADNSPFLSEARRFS